jgi:His-Xaa-Ser system protein HxsD
MIKIIDDNQLFLEISANIYDPETILQTAYNFNDKCSIHVDSVNTNIFRIYFKKADTINSDLEEIVNKFCIDLIDQQMRIRIEKSFGNIRDILVKKAFSPIESGK